MLTLLPGCGAKGDLFLAEPSSKQTTETTEVDSKNESQVVEPIPESDQTAHNGPILDSERASK